MNERTAAWLRRKFRIYYSRLPKDQITTPRLSLREFGITSFTRKGMLRHLSFHDRADLLGFLGRRGPSRVYHSCAYYRQANSKENGMKGKGWMGADLVFDIDCDHLAGAASMSYEEQLELARRQLVRLYDEFLMGDFGFDPKDMQIVFSGGRGYHVHVRDQRIMDLNSAARREIVDYISGTGLALAFAEPKPGKLGYVDWTYPHVDEPGWKGRIGRGLPSMLAEATEKGVQEYFREQAEAHDLEATTKFVSSLERSTNQAMARDPLHPPLTFFLPKEVDFLLELLKRQKRVQLTYGGEVDGPVTYDVHRLIRMANSIHQSTGFRVVELDRDQLDGFTPFQHAVVFHEEEPMLVDIREDVQLRLAKWDMTLKAGRQDIPEGAALHLCLRGKAELPQDVTVETVGKAGEITGSREHVNS